MLRSRPLSATPLVIACLTGLAACTSYRSEPLDVGAHRAEWSARTPWLPEASKPPGDTGDVEPQQTLTLSEAELVALVFNSDLRLARLRVEAARAIAEREGRLADPELSFDALRILESVSNPWILASGITLTLPLSGRLRTEKRRALAEVDVELYRVAETEWTIRRQVRDAWFEWSALDEQARATERAATSIEPLVETVKQLAEIGEASPLDATLLAIEHARLEQSLRRLRIDAAAKVHDLRTLLGLSPGAPFPLVPSLDLEDSIESRPDTLERNPELARLRAEYEVAELRLEREVRASRPDLTLGPAYESDEGQPRLGLLGSLPIPVFDANGRAIAEARAARDLARAAFETTAERAWGRHAAIRDRIAAVAADREALDTHLVQPLDAQIADAQQLLQIGEVDAAVLIAILLRSHDLQLERIERQRDESRLRAELAYLEGPRLPEPAIPVTTPSEETP